jgi:hypothetical protein
MRQQLGEPGDGMGSDAREDILEPGVGIDPHALTRCHEAPQHSRCVAALVAAKKDPVVALMYTCA